MKILFDIGHPAHVHYFKNLIRILEQKNHKCVIIARKKEITHQLLDNYLIKYKSRGQGLNTLTGKFFNSFYVNFKILTLS